MKEKTIRFNITSLETLIEKLRQQDLFVGILLDIDDPFICYKTNNKEIKLFLADSIRLKQIYYNQKCFRKGTLPINSLNFALKYLTNNQISFTMNQTNKLSEISINNKIFKFVYEYALSAEYIISLAPKTGLHIVNLHNWNGEGCITQEAYEQAEIMSVKLFTQKEFFGYVHKIK